MAAKIGVPPKELDDGELRRELHQLWETRPETIFTGSAQAVETHTRRMLELEGEFMDRFAEETAPAPGRTRRGARARSGQAPDGRSP